jgi:hypothetical protein
MFFSQFRGMHETFISMRVVLQSLQCMHEKFPKLIIRVHKK